MPGGRRPAKLNARSSRIQLNKLLSDAMLVVIVVAFIVLLLLLVFLPVLGVLLVVC